jgi:DNA-binding HxlR family transcriptional regulator
MFHTNLVDTMDVATAASAACDALAPEEDRLARDIMSRVTDTWSMWVIHVLGERSPMRFSRIAEEVEGVSQKMLTKTLRQLERDGLVTRRIFMEVPPRVEYALTPTGRELMLKFLPLWLWIVEQLPVFVAARQTYEARLALER